MNEITLPKLRERKFDGQLKAFKNYDEAREASRWLLAVKYGGEGITTAGGFLTPIETLTSAIIAYRDKVGLARRFASVYPLTTDTASVPRRNGNAITASFTAENITASFTDVLYDNVTFSPKKLVAATRVSTELEEDAGSGFFADWLAAELGWAIAYREDRAMILGDGTSTYGDIQGIKARFDAGVGSFVGAVDPTAAVDTFAEVTATDLAKAVGTIPTWALDRAAWYCSQPCYANVFCRLAAGAGGIRVVNGELTFWGLPIRVSNIFPTATTTINDTPMLYVGDLSSAVYFGSRRDFRLKRAGSRFIESDSVGYFASTRFDIVADVGDSSAASGLVALMGNT